MSFNHKTLIVYLDGDYRRFKTVADIYKKFKDGDAHILITSFNDNNQLRGKIDLLNDNYDFIDESHILTEYYSTSTYNNAIEIEEILKKINYGHIIIVTSQYHIYRTRLIFKDRFKNDSRFCDRQVKMGQLRQLILGQKRQMYLANKKCMKWHLKMLPLAVPNHYCSNDSL